MTNKIATKVVGHRHGERRVIDSNKKRLGGVRFLNARPLLYGLLQGRASERFHLDMNTPSELARGLIEEELDAALAPAAILAHHGQLEIVPDIAIACEGPVKSVAIFSEKPLDEITTVLLDEASRTSVLLARVILHERYPGKTFTFAALPTEDIDARIEDDVAALVIGDAALALNDKHAFELDLGAAWHELTGLPFVFAVWAVVPGKLTRDDVDHLIASKAEGLSARRSIAEGWAKEAGGDATVLEHYLREHIRYDLGACAFKGLQVFLDKCAALGLLPKTELRLFSETPKQRFSTLPSVDALLDKGASGGRLSFVEALRLEAEAPLHELGLAADMRRKAIHPHGVVTYIVDRNINYTNVCTTSCRFCAFYRPVGHAEGYVLTREQLAQKIEETVAAGGIQILLQGGLNPDLRLEWYEDLFRWMKANFAIALHALSPEEIWHLSRLENLPIETILRRMRDAGMDSLPGGGAEILTDRVRRKIAKGKCTSWEWLECMRVVHRLGMKSTATMMFGTVDNAVDRVAHLLKIRDLQDETGGFTAFIAWDYQYEQGVRVNVGEAGTLLYLRTQALSRLVLDNVPSIQSSWVTQGPGVGQVALRYGANDMGSTMFEENVVSSAGTTFDMDARAIENAAHAAGFKVAQRNMRYTWLTDPR